MARGKCPICGKDNHCVNAGEHREGTCWCDKEDFPRGIFQEIPLEELGKTCICKDCLEEFRQRQLRQGVHTPDFRARGLK